MATPKKRIEIADADFIRRMENADIAHSTTKVKERDQRFRKSIIDLKRFFLRVSRWQRERTSLLIANGDLELLIVLLLGEIEEILEHRELEGLSGYDFKSEKGETIDVGFFLASLTYLLNQQDHQVDFDTVMLKANGQSNSSRAIENLREVGGNLSERSLETDLKYLWTLWVSYLLHMKFPVDPNQVLTEYTLPKNNGNYITRLLFNNPAFERKFLRRMNDDEHKQYFKHYRKATRIIRDFVISYIDPNVEHTGLKEAHYIKYEKYIFSFMDLYGFNAEQALDMLKEELYKDYGIKKTESGLLVTKSLAFIKE